MQNGNKSLVLSADASVMRIEIEYKEDDFITLAKKAIILYNVYPDVNELDQTTSPEAADQLIDDLLAEGMLDVDGKYTLIYEESNPLHGTPAITLQSWPDFSCDNFCETYISLPESD